MNPAPTSAAESATPSLSPIPGASCRSDLVDAIDQILPQTQCRRCGYDACRPYAQAVAAGLANINRCPPGGHTGIKALAAITGLPEAPLDPSCGVEGPIQLARIREEDCIGCVLCLEACPVDAIAGAFKRMHAVIEEDCTGCALCIPVCPVDCIEMVTPTRPIVWDAQAAERARASFERRQSRQAMPISLDGSDSSLGDKKKAILAAAMARAARRRQAP